jgi:ribosomal protein S6--L-glutamate ligase
MLVYILSRGANLYSTSRIFKAAQSNKHNVRVIDHMECDLLIEEGEYKVVFNNEVLIKPDIVIPRIGSSATYYGTSVVRHFEMMGVKVLNPSMAIQNSRDKFRSLQILMANEIRVPTTFFSYDMHYAENVVEQKLGYPFIIKVLEGTQGNGVHLIQNELKARKIIGELNPRKKQIMLQEFITEFRGKDIRAFVVGDKVVASYMRIAQGNDFRSNIHRGGVGKMVHITNEEKELSIESSRCLGLNVAGVDMMRSHKGSMVIEVNSSPGLEGVEKYTKVDVAKKIIDFVENM